MLIYGHYWDLNGDRKRVFLDFYFDAAMIRCDSVKIGLWYQTNATHIMNIYHYM